VRLVPCLKGGYPDPLHLGSEGRWCDPKSAESTRIFMNNVFTMAGGCSRDLILWCLVPDLEFHALNVAHDDSHLRTLCGLVQQGHLAQVVCSLCSSLASAVTVRSVLEAGMSLRTLGLLCLLVLVHGAIEMLLLVGGR
jgi:hypothetical protein